MSRTSNKAQGERLYGAFADALQQWILAYRMHHVRSPFYQRDLAEATGINVTFISKMVRGRDIPTSRQCLMISRFFGVDVQEVLRAAGYPDVNRLIQIVANTTRGTIKDRQYILSWLEAAQSPQWQGLDWESSIYKERADDILSLELEPYAKAHWYADVVYNWMIDPQRDLAPSERITYDHAVIVS